MDLIKLQTEMLNKRFPSQHMNKAPYFFDPIDGKYYISPDTKFIFVADAEEILLDMEKVGIESPACISICENAEKEAQTELILNKDLTVNVPDTYGKKAVYLEGGDLKILVNEAYLKLITKNEEAQYFGYGELAPVIIKSHDKVIGLVAPMRQNNKG